MEIKNLIKSDQKLEEISNKDLYHLCQKYGRGIKVLRRVFSVLLVEVFRRNLHRKYGFESIHEFAAKVGGMNRALVGQILSLAVALKDKPLLWKTFRTDGWSKLRVVVCVATKETDEFWAKKVELLRKSALEVYVKWYKEEKLLQNQLSVFDNFPKNGANNRITGLLEPKMTLAQNLGEKLSVEPAENAWKTKLVKIRFNISGEAEFRFRSFKQRLSKKRKMVVTSGETLQEMLEIVEKSIATEKEWHL